MLKDYMLHAVANLQRRKLRSWLTMLGIFIGIATIVTLISLGQGLKEVVFSQFSFLTPDMITITTGMSSYGPASTVSNPFTEKQIRIIEDSPGIYGVAPRLVRNVLYTIDDKRYSGMVFSIPPGKRRDMMYEALSMHFVKGDRLEDGDRYEVIVGYNVANSRSLDKPLRIGDKITIDEQHFTLKGIMEKKGNFMLDNVIAMNEDIMQNLFDIPKDEFTIIAAKVDRGYDVDNVIEYVEDKLRRARDVKEGEEDFEVASAQDTLEQMEATMFAVQLFIYIIAGISIVVGGIGIMNTMFTSVLERTKDIGIMKAIGAKNSTIFTLFFIESGLLGMVGGIIGIILGYALGTGAEQLGNVIGGAGSQLIQAHFPPMLLIGALLGSFIIGSISGIWPAMSAARLHPVDALSKTK